MAAENTPLKSTANGDVSSKINTTYPDYDYLLKILLIGDSNTGKSSLLVRFCDDSFSDTFISTIGVDFKVKTIAVDNKLIKLQIWDSAGQERFRTLTTAYYRGAHGIIIVYDISDSNTFVSVEGWMKEVYEKAAPNVIKMLVGNKCDRSNIEVEYDAAKTYANAKGLSLMEVSAKYGINVEQIFYNLVTEINKSGCVNMEEKISRTESKVVLQGTEIKERNSSCCSYL